MPDTGYQPIKPQSSVRSAPFLDPTHTSEQEASKSLSEASSKSTWLLTGSMAFAFLLGMVLWVAVIERVWGAFLWVAAAP